jgi:hypothetical protein
VPSMRRKIAPHRIARLRHDLALMNCASLLKAADRAGITRMTLGRWLFKNKHGFADKFRLARQIGSDMWAEEIQVRGSQFASRSPEHTSRQFKSGLQHHAQWRSVNHSRKSAEDVAEAPGGDRAVRFATGKGTPRPRRGPPWRRSHSGSRGRPG